MNDIILRGIIRDIEYSHTINNVEYCKANLIVSREDDKEDIISLRFKKFSCQYKNDDYVELVGNLRSYSRKMPDGKNKVEIYVFTYFDYPSEEKSGYFTEGTNNEFLITGRVCKINQLHQTKSGKQNLQFILANNIISNNGQKINNYIPLVGWGYVANQLVEANLKVNDSVSVRGQLHSRTYTKTLDNGDVEIRVAHEGVLLGIIIDYSQEDI